MAEQSFKSDDDGRRLFYIGSPFSRPYLIPDASTEARLFLKMTWNHRIFSSALILGQPFLFRYYFLRQPWLFLVFLVLVMVLQWVVLRAVFLSDLRSLERRPSRLSLRMFYLGMAQRHSESGLVLGLLGCIVFVICGVFISAAGGWMLALSMPVVVFFGFCGAGWGYVLHLKWTTTTQRSSE